MKCYTISSIVYIIVSLQCFGGDLGLPHEILQRIDEKFSNESKNSPEIEIANKNNLRRVVCCSGFLVGQVGFRFDIFPELGFLRIAATGNVNNLNWLYIQVDVEDPEKIGLRTKDGAIRLRKDLKDKVMACGSGILFKDITSGEYLCRLDNEYWVVSRQTKRSGVLIPAFKILVCARNGESMLESISLFNGIWRDCDDSR
jgi:hypothetical protein